jgi:hypothetical protein
MQCQTHREIDYKVCFGALSDLKTEPKVLTRLLDNLTFRDAPKEIAFTLKDSNSLVIYNNAVTTVGQLLNKRREMDPTSVVNYHKLNEIPADGDGPSFTLTNSHTIVFAMANPMAMDEGEGHTTQQKH